MLEQKDLDAIRSILKEKLASSKNMILEEVDRVQENLKTKNGKYKEKYRRAETVLQNYKARE